MSMSLEEMKNIDVRTVDPETLFFVYFLMEGKN